jgi:hypothetical protein
MHTERATDGVSKFFRAKLILPRKDFDSLRQSCAPFDRNLQAKCEIVDVDSALLRQQRLVGKDPKVPPAPRLRKRRNPEWVEGYRSLSWPRGADGAALRGAIKLLVQHRRPRGTVSSTKADLDAWVLASMVREPEESAPILPNINAQDLTASLEVRHYLRAELRQDIRQLRFARERLLEEIRLVRSTLRENNDRG